MLATIRKYLLLIRWFHCHSENSQLAFLARSVAYHTDGVELLMGAFDALTITSLLCQNYKLIITYFEAKKDLAQAETYTDRLDSITHAEEITEDMVRDFTKTLLDLYRNAKEFGL
jgi:hypothetical protein